MTNICTVNPHPPQEVKFCSRCNSVSSGNFMSVENFKGLNNFVMCEHCVDYFVEIVDLCKESWSNKGNSN